MKRLLLLFGVCFVGVKVTLSQPAPTFPASQAQTTAGVVGAPFYLTPRSIQYIPFIATNLNPVFVTNLVNGSSNLLVTTSFPTNELWVDPVKGSSSASGAYATPLDNLTNALPLIISRGGGTVHLTPGTTNAILTANNIVSNVYIDGRGATITFAATNAASPGVFVVNGNATFSDFKYYGITNDFQLPFDFTLNLANNSTIVFDNLYVFNASDIIYDNGGTARTGISVLVNNCRFESYFDNVIITAMTAPTLRFVNSVFRATNPYGTSPTVSSGTTVRNFRMSGFSSATIVFDSCLIESLNGTNQNTAVDISTGSGHFQWHNCTIVSLSTNLPGTYFTLKGGTHDIYGSSISTYPPSSGTLNFFGSTKLSSTNGYAANTVFTSDGTNGYWAVSSASGGGSLFPPAALGVLTNTAGGVSNWSTAIPGTWIAPATLPITAADTSWMSITQAVAYSNATGLPIIGNALVIIGTNVNGAILVIPTNWPSGGNTPSGLVTNSAATDVVVTNAGVNTTITSNSVTTGTGTYTLGSVSLIPTNAAVVLTAVGVAPSMPFGITNSLSGRAQPVVQYYFIDAVTGVPILTFSNEASGVKFRVSAGALANVETNFCLLPITSTNTIWRARDESTGSGASVGILTNWFIGL